MVEKIFTIAPPILLSILYGSIIIGLIMKNTVDKAIIVGASSGIGREVARRLLADGWTLGLAARRTEQLQELRQLAPHRVSICKLDVNVSDAEKQLLQLISDIGGMDLYFHASGIGFQNSILDSQLELDTIQTNAVGFCRMIGAAFRYFAKQGRGHIAAITSIAGTRGLGVAPAYSATKALQNVYLESLVQLAHMRALPICITDIRPGFVRTPLLGDDPHFPMLMTSQSVARHIVRAVYARRKVIVIDNRWRMLTFLWRLVPHWIWRRLSIGKL